MSSSSSSDWSRVRELFETAVELPPEERPGFLSQHCGHDDLLRQRVEKLLAADGALASAEGMTLERPIAAAAAQGIERDLARLVTGQCIGGYQIERVLGSGGMSTVFAARQEQPRRTVALKTMRLGLLSEEARRRFVYESEVLGRLRHPGIAQVYEAGTWREPLAGEEVPFFAMEYVEDALPIDAYVAQEVTAGRLDLHAMLRLFLEVCDAVHHGHQQGVIHRDLKPQNVLVDGVGRPKVIDFGIARATESDRQELTLQTRPGHVLGTLRYMAPEQLDGSADADTRIDVYALGVILYELLAGKPPFDPGDRSLTRFAAHVRQHEPPRPSDSDAGFQLSGLATDLDWIVRKAIAADRDERYGSVSELAAEIQRCLDHEPVLAGPPSTSYYVRKFIRRNRAAVVGLSAVFLALLLGFVTTFWQMLRAQDARDMADRESTRAQEAAATAKRQARRAETINAFFNEMLKFADVNEGRYRSRPDWTLREALDAVAGGIDKLAEEPLAQADVHEQLGNAYRSLGQQERSEHHLRQVVALRRQHLGPEHPEVARGLSTLGATRSRQGKHEEAKELYEQSNAILSKTYGTDHPDIAVNLLNMGSAELVQKDLDAAEQHLNEAVAMYRRLPENFDRMIAIALAELARVARKRGDRKQAILGFREAITTFETAGKGWHPYAGSAHEHLAEVLLKERQRAAAEAEFRKALDVYDKCHGPDNVRSAHCHTQLGHLLLRRHQMEEAETHVRAAERIYTRLYGNDNDKTIAARRLLAMHLRAQKRIDEALVVAQKGFESVRRTVQDNDLLYRMTMVSEYARCLREAGRLKEAEELFRRRVLANQRRGTPGTVLMAKNDLGVVLSRMGRHREADALLSEVVKTAPRHLRKGHYLHGLFRRAYGECLTRQARYKEAEVELQQALAVFERTLGRNHANVHVVLENLANLYEAWDKPDKAKAMRAEAHRERR